MASLRPETTACSFLYFQRLMQMTPTDMPSSSTVCMHLFPTSTTGVLESPPHALTIPFMVSHSLTNAYMQTSFFLPKGFCTCHSFCQESSACRSSCSLFSSLIQNNSVSVQTVLEKKVTDHPFQTHHQPIGHSVILA